MGRLRRYAFIAILGLLILAGVAAGLWQLREGLAVTAMREPVVWGLYVVCFVYFAGLGAGALFVASLALALGRETGRPIARAAAPVGLIGLVLGGM